ncbi:MMPL family transporter [Kineococcus gypseus]|uniref:MMPL family transporter n=1 Tax=Kineococcus gypseus TaxID=1637102 RepID=UPI003D7CF827
MAKFLYRLGSLGARRPGTLLIVWSLLVVGVVVAGVLGAGTFASSSSIPGSPAQAALTAMDEHFPSSGQSAQIVVQAPAGRTLGEPDLRAALTSVLDAAGAVPGVSGVSDPSTSGTLSEDGRTAVARVTFSTPEDAVVPAATLSALERAASLGEDAGAEVVVTGDAFSTSASLAGPSELIGVLTALAVLAVTFGSLLVAGMPLVIAVVGVVVSSTALIGLSSVFDISDNALTLAAMIGLAVGIDYALFILSRHRTQLAEGMEVRRSIATATATAGSAVVFAGATVVIALCGLSVAGVPILTSMGLAAAGSVAVAVTTALGLLPALMGLAGRRLVPRPGSRTARRLTAPARTPLGTRWISAVVRRPVLAVVVVVTGLLVAAAPALQMETAVTDAGSEAVGTSERRAHDMISDAFGAGANGPLLVLVTAADPAAVSRAAEQAASSLVGVRGVAATSGIDVAEDGLAARIQVVPTTGPRDAATAELVTRLDAAVAPAARSGSAEVAVTGQTAVGIDVAGKLSSALLPFALVVVGLSLLLLLVAFRSVAVPLKATVGFLLSLGATSGAIVAVFQFGWLAQLLGVPSTGPVGSFVPIIVMAVLFGLAMDYEVFLVSSIREEHARTRDAKASIVTGTRHAARVVTAAALIMIAVFAGFLPSRDPDIVPIAFGLGVGVLIDAFAVRMTLVPAVLALLGERAWSLPRWLERVVPTVDVEGAELARTRAANGGVDTAAGDVPSQPGERAGAGRERTPS